jgi:NAD-dependent SIR2 family protein deacetylase
MIQQTERYFKCPECGAVAVVDEDIEPGEFETCLECDEEIDPPGYLGRVLGVLSKAKTWMIILRIDALMRP